ncbi:uncharacterized protein [Spinacia oleracea]|uniref:Uncharacterized protein isoform X2 n=1 Tax=Spinacia oleracea TaxID=3562 RepID=A0ABM3QNB4_SPIOL|nr:uncharacterized protein LOC110784578 isoform X2 [Spinacia oleracea]
MRETLEVRLAASEEERKAAEKEMQEKQEIAKGALAEQELIMEQVVQESKLLQQEAEENSKEPMCVMWRGRMPFLSCLAKYQSREQLGMDAANPDI